MPCIFLGYENENFGYRVWNLDDGKVYKRQNVNFQDDETIVDFNESIWRKAVYEQVERVVVVSHKHHTNGNATTSQKRMKMLEKMKSKKSHMLVITLIIVIMLKMVVIISMMIKAMEMI